jgi:hypothetical protein
MPVRPCLLRYSRRFSLALAIGRQAAGAPARRVRRELAWRPTGRPTPGRRHSAVVSERSSLPCSESDRIAAQQRNDALGQSRQFGRLPATSGLTRLADISSVRRHVSKVPNRDVAECEPQSPRPHEPVGSAATHAEFVRRIGHLSINLSRQATAFLLLPEKNRRFNSAAGFAALNR